MQSVSLNSTQPQSSPIANQGTASPTAATSQPQFGNIKADTYTKLFQRSSSTDDEGTVPKSEQQKKRGFTKGMKTGFLLGTASFVGGIALLLSGVAAPIGCAVMALSPVLGFAGFMKGLLKG